MTTMTIPHEAAHRAGWPLAAGAVASLPADAAPRLLLVLCGQVWITERIDDGEPRQAVDHWLDAGQTLALPAGSRWIVEARHRARLVLLQPPPAARGLSAASAGAAVSQALRRAVRRAGRALTERPASPGAPRAA